MNVQSTIAVLISLFTILVPQSASAMMGELKRPRLPMAKTLTEADYVKLNAVLDRKDVTYIKGPWINSFSSLQYSSDTLGLNLFLGALTECPKVSVHICFFRPSVSGIKSDWLVTHTANSNKLVVRINLDSASIDLTKLYIPTIPPKRSPREGMDPLKSALQTRKGQPVVDTILRRTEGEVEPRAEGDAVMRESRLVHGCRR